LTASVSDVGTLVKVKATTPSGVEEAELQDRTTPDLIALEVWRATRWDGHAASLRNWGSPTPWKSTRPVPAAPAAMGGIAGGGPPTSEEALSQD